MRIYETSELRNVIVVGHGASGKTQLTETMLFDSGATNRLGAVDEGHATTDYDPEELKRKISINLGLVPIEWNDKKINVLDTPGYFDFIGDVKHAVRVSDGAVVVLCAVGGVEVETERAWEYLNEDKKPRVVFVNKMDRELADFNKAVDSLKEAFPETHAVPLQLPIGAEADFRGVVDLVENKAYEFGPDGKPKEVEIPGDLTERAAELRDTIIEAAAEGDDELTEKYLEEEALTEEEIHRGLAEAVANGILVPVLCGSATKNIGVSTLLSRIVDWLPNPVQRGAVSGVKPGSDEVVSFPTASDSPFSAFVFKTAVDPYAGKLTYFRVYSGELSGDSSFYNASRDESERATQLFLVKGKEQIPVDKLAAGDIGAVAKLSETQTGDTLCNQSNPIVYPAVELPDPVLGMAISSKSKGDEDKLASCMHRLMEEDPTLHFERDSDIQQTVISGMGDLHVNVRVAVVKDKFGLDVDLTPPRVAYRETITGQAEAQGKYKKQTGGRGMYGDVWLRVEPRDRGEGFEFVNAIVGGVVPQRFIPGVEKGVREAMQKGILCGYPVVDCQVTLYDGSFHSVDSSEMAFKIAASMGFKKAMEAAGPILLEPIMDVEIVTPSQYVGDIMGDVSAKRGRVMGIDPKGNKQLIHVQIPRGELGQYSIDLRQITQGRAGFSMKFLRYEPAPHELIEKFQAKAQQTE